MTHAGIGIGQCFDSPPGDAAQPGLRRLGFWSAMLTALSAAAALGIAAESKSKVGKFTPPPARPPGKIICADDTPEGKAAELAKLLREEAKVI